jgi:transcriptional regulator of acetoin/glycerol metabolism
MHARCALFSYTFPASADREGCAVRRDIAVRFEAIERAKSQVRASSTPSLVDPVVHASWQRCLPLDPARRSAPVDPADDSRERWDDSPIRRAAPGLIDQFDQAARSSDLAASIADSEGRVLWRQMPRWLRAGADDIGFVPGGMWHEAISGTCGMGTALAADRPVTVFATEHWLGRVNDWVCYGAPVHAADGTQLGVISMSTSWRRANPLGLTTVATIARLIEVELRAQDQPAAPVLDLRVLGEPVALLDGQPLRLTQRQFEILTILALSESASLGSLHDRLYGDRSVLLGTLKAELSRLRRRLRGHLHSRPYRLTLTTRVDAVELQERLDVGDVDGATRLYAGQLLPDSESPFLIEQRHQLDVALRTALLHEGGTSGALRFAMVHPYDTEVLDQARRLAPADDPLLPAVVARLAVATSLA